MKARSLNRMTVAALLAVAPALVRAEEKAPAETPPAAGETEAAQPEEPMLEAPADVAAPPADAEKTESGLASKVLTKGTGDAKPTAADTVTVHYSGWTTDGELFDSSVKRGQPTSFPLNGVIKGWTEGLQLMTVGEKRRFWIPADLAYGENPGGGRPGGMLVFDVELIEIKEVPKVPEDALKSAGGVAYKVISEGDGGETPGDGDVVTFHFTAKSMEGQVMQDTRSQPAPPSVPVDKLPAEMKEMITGMTKGEKRSAWLPEARLPGGHVVAEFELVSFKAAPPAPPVPDDVAAVPDDAAKTESGLASKVLKAGEGEDMPKATDTVKVHYTGWTTDGKLFDSSVTRGEPTQFPLNGVIKGWTEGLQLMKVGEKRRFWIPADLAYGENPGGGRPGGMLVFDVELLEIVR
ncbi:FKBP-type peptidyl-prolyl cis-trans isomerase [Haloferula helveola]